MANTWTSQRAGAWSTDASNGASPWNGGGNPASGIPASGDTVTIATGHNVTFDVDQSGFAAGLASLVITGTLTASTTAGAYYLKMAGHITGTGSLVAGSSGTAYPTDCTFTILLNGNYYTNLSAPGAYQLYCAQPTHTYVKLSGNEALGQTVLSVDTDISAETAHWKSGAILRIDDVDKVQDTQQTTFVSATATEITVGDALDSAVVAGAYIHLISRNIKIIGTSISGSAYGIYYGTSGNIGAELRLLNRGATNGVRHTFSGTVSGCNNGIYLGTGHTISGTVSGNTYGFNEGVGHTIIGIVSGNDRGISVGMGHTIGGIVSGNGNSIYGGMGHTISGTVSGNTAGVYKGTGFIASTAVFSSNTRDANLTEGGIWFGNGAALNSTTPVTVPPAGYALNGIFVDNIGGTAGAYKGWQYGGIVTTVDSQYPTGFTQSYQHALTAEYPCFWERRVVIRAGETLRFTAHFRKDASMSYLPRVWVFEEYCDPIINASWLLLEQAMTDSTDTWESYALSYKNTAATTKNYIIRMLAKNASGNVYTQLYLPPAGAAVARMERIP